VGVVVVLAVSGLFEVVVGMVGRFTLPGPSTAAPRSDEAGTRRSGRMFEEA
jgi:hypothetical protein